MDWMKTSAAKIARRHHAWGQQERSGPPSPQERAMISAWRFGHITRAQLEEKIGKARADALAPEGKR